MKYNSKIWGPHYWFFLFTVSLNYPHSPNNLTKKKYYNLIRNFHLFIPDNEISGYFESLINEFPVTPYLDNRNTFVRWVVFIHNQINIKLKKPKITLKKALYDYYLQYVPEKKPFFTKQKILFITISLLSFLLILYLYQI
tara:strand:+ start:371 stop:790 length:420 start_codon:yes stop_codon:yes gene_type:complete